jgi:exosortase
MTPKLFWVMSLGLPIPLVVNYFANLWSIDQYQFFIVLILAIGAMYYSRWNRAFCLPTTPVQICLLALGWFIAMGGTALYSPWLGYLGFLFITSSFSSTHYEKISDDGHEPTSAGTLFYLTIPLWLCLRAPLNFDQKLTIGLQHLTAGVSSFLLDKLSVPHQVSGVIFDLASGKLFVEEACSGVQSLFALLCVSLLLLAWNRRPIVLVPVYAAAAIFSAALLNIIRVVTIAVAQEWYALDLAHGWKHDLLGYSCLMLAILLLASFDRLFRVVFFPLSDDTTPIAQSRTANPIKLVWNKFLSPVSDAQLKRKISSTIKTLPKWQFPIFIAAGVLCLGCQLVFGTQRLLKEKEVWVDPPVGGTEMFWIPSKELFANQTDLVIEGFESFRNGEDRSGGQNTDVWMVLDTKTKLRHRIAISQPYDGFHDLCICYAGNGWRMGEREVTRHDSSTLAIGGWGFIFSNWFNDDGSYAYLTFSGLNSDNTPAAIPDETVADIFANRFALGGNSEEKPKECLMLQVWTTLDSPLTKDEQAALKQFHIQVRDVVRPAFAQK